MRFLIDAMFPPEVAEQLSASGHDAVSPAGLGLESLSDSSLIEIATAQRRVIVTENASDFADVTTCAVVLVRKSWWPPHALAPKLYTALAQWAEAHPDPGPWPRWLDAEFR